MSSQQLQNEVFDKLTAIPENRQCFECRSPSFQWASVNNGIFLCLACSGVHRGFGVNVSFIRSIDMDHFTQKQLNLMLQGGNKKLWDFFESYNIPKDSPIDFKYKTKAGIYYRELLKSIVEGEQSPDKPSLEEGLEIISFQNPNFLNDMSQNKGITSQNHQSNNNKNDDTLDQVKSVLTGALTKVTEVGKTVYEKTAEISKNVYQKGNEKLKDEQFQQDVNNFKEKSKETIIKNYKTIKQGFFQVLGFFQNQIDNLDQGKQQNKNKQEQEQEQKEFGQQKEQQKWQLQQEWIQQDYKN
ncbi:hypothetical protein IMG5_201980 [Ichthyophthirius multifiliis]|uniref:Arf-GAP domain-containing protein n=1 Tax=Ichthyophthirius multifiliis TaxID=5932 RepID=G0R615_ICHMU|nr:hypothetical protein IMG5_201980 [Ichthyophthirius multifiliis]EGR27081.1 hypothetical protein IMG5_201980 [Ichthyophthirius multifiliis]|eukprot:XP_004023965.1 hypothetical protein IMG5_201980 [Ichthyophthirius multifiliis]